MPGIIDSFVVALGWDTRDYEKGKKKLDADQKAVKERTLRNAKDIEAGARKMGHAIEAVRREVVGLFAAFTAGAGLTTFINDTIKADAQAGRLAKQIGTTTSELTAWQGVLRRNGGTSEEATGALQSVTRAFEELQLTGTSDKIPYLQTLGISLRDLEDPAETLLKISDKLSKMDPRRAEALGRGLGLSPNTIAVLIQGRQAVERMLEEQRKLGVTTDADARAAQRLQDVLSGLKDGSARLGRTLLTALAPALEAGVRLLQDFATWAQKNAPVVTGAVLGLAAAFVALSLPIIATVAPALALAGALAAVGMALGWVVQHIDEFPELKKAIDDVAAAGRDLGDAFKKAVDAVPPEVWRALGGAMRDGVLGVIHDMRDGLRVVADALRIVAALLRGDFSGAWREAGKLGNDVIAGWKTKLADARNAIRNFGSTLAGRQTPAPKPGTSAAAVTQTGRGAINLALDTLRRFEGYRAKAYWDVNAFRAGYGSDTITDPKTGRVTKVTKDTKDVSKEQADADLRRRVTQEFEPRTARAVGPAWQRLDDKTKAALVSVAYNYGSLPAAVRDAARTGDRKAIADAIEARATDNQGANRDRRLSEAAMVRGPTTGLVQAAAPPAPVSNDNRSTQVDIGSLNVYTQATDAAGIARNIAPAVRRELNLATQANTGLQ